MFTLLFAAQLATLGLTTPESSTAAAAASTAPAVERVGGDLDIEAKRAGGEWLADRYRINFVLPEGYPDPTPPGAIDLKRYPSVRRAIVLSDGDPVGGSSTSFFLLFRHIEQNDIAMTSPVEMTYPDDANPEANYSMAFLYRTPELGPTGTDGAIDIEDSEPVTVLAIGFAGASLERRIDEFLPSLEAWLEASDEWERDGAARVLAYNGPIVPVAMRWNELQVPIRRTVTEEDAAGDRPAVMPETIGGAG